MAKAYKRSRQAVPHLAILEDISTLIGHSQDIQESLKSIVAIVADRMKTEVCSLYILEAQKNRLTLRATMGLDQESVGKVSMGTDEGLTGLVIQQMSPVMAVDAQAHPRYKYFPETGEERFHSFLGVPLIERRRPLGVLVVQTSRRREFSRDELRLLKAISAQVASIIVQSRLLDSLKDKERERKEYQKRLGEALRRLRTYEGKHGEKISKGVAHKWRGRITGLSVAPGFGRGTAYVLKPRMDLSAIKKERAKKPQKELERFRAAIERGIEQIHLLKERMSALISREEGALFDVHRLILEDRALIEQVEVKIRKEEVVAEYAVGSVFD
ncbi:MAG: phosphoenolpyruvate-utilizing N-terminal domain-containing protein, partial [Candidatus Binatia bacterium]